MQETKPLPRTIQQVLHEFARECVASLEPRERHAYRRVLFFLELCINSYGHRNLEDPERSRYEARRREGDDVRFFELFGPRWLLPELDFFVHDYVRRDVFTSARLERKASEVVEELKRWMVGRRYVEEADVDEAEAAFRARRELRLLARRATRLLGAWSVAVDPSFFARSDYLEIRDVPIKRVAPGRIWLLVYRHSRAELVGPLTASIAATRSLRIGFCLNGSIARIRGRWHLTGVDSVYPRGPLEPVCAQRRRG